MDFCFAIGKKAPWNSSDVFPEIHQFPQCFLSHTERGVTIWIRNGEAQVRLKWAAMISMPGTLFKAEKLVKLRWNLPDEKMGDNIISRRDERFATWPS